MIKIIFVLSLFAVFMLGCKKHNEKLENLYIRGRLFLTDTIANLAIDSVLSKKIVHLAEDNGDTLNFLYSDTTDNDGYFVFNLLNDGKTNFVIRYEEKMNGIIYSANQQVTKGQNNIAVDAVPNQTKQNALHLIVADSANGRVVNATAWVFNSALLFAADTSAGKIFDMTTDNVHGVSNRFNIPAGRYYLRVKTKIGSIEFKGEGITDIENIGIKTLVIIINRVSNIRNGFQLLILDSLSTPVNNVQVYGYRSKSVFLIDSANANSIFTLSSNSAGQASLYNIDSARYYLRTVKQVGNTVFRSMDSVDVNNSAITNKTIRLN